MKIPTDAFPRLSKPANQAKLIICALVFFISTQVHANHHNSLAEEGKATFNTYCVACHQAEGHGKVGFAPDISNRDFLAAASDAFLKESITKGRPGTAMMPWGMLNDKQVDSIIAFLRSHKEAIPSPVSVDPKKKHRGNARHGKTKYETYCASCHGTNGQGYAAGGSGPAIGLKGFLDAASDDFIYQTVKHGRIGTAMRAFIGAEGVANLTDSDIADIISYLRDPASGASPVQSNAVSYIGDPKKGEEQFNINCAACHQMGGIGKVGFAPSVRNRDFLAIASDDFIRATIKKGRPGTSMIARPDLPETVINNIIAYLRALPIENEITISVDPSKKVSGSAKEGKYKYEIYCASCHGPKGEGYITGGSGPGIGLKGFLDTASDDYILQTAIHGRIGTAMRPMVGAKGVANLSEQDINDIIIYLRTLNK